MKPTKFSTQARAAFLAALAFTALNLQRAAGQCALSISGTKTICNGQSSVWTANASGGSSYTYLWNTGATTQSITATAPGTYSVTATGTLTISNGTSIINNGTFSSGNTGFNSDYFYSSTGGWGSYFISSDTKTNFTWMSTSCADHSPSADNLQLIADGSTTANQRVWYEVLPVDPNTTYNLSAWVQSLSADGTAGATAKLQFAVNGTLIGSQLQLPTTICTWANLTTSWSSGSATSVTISIIDNNTASSYNDFAIDDITMIPVTTQCQITASDDLNVIAFTTPNAGLDKNQCGNNVFSMTANTIPTGTGTWSVVSGSATITNVNSPNATVTLSGTTATLRWTSTNGTCSGYDDVVITNTVGGGTPLYCNCGPIVGNVESSATNYNRVKPLNISTGLFGAQMGTDNSADYTAASAWDSRYQRLYVVGYNNRVIYYQDNNGNYTSTTVTLPSNTYNRAAFNPIDNLVYITSSTANWWGTYAPTAGGTGGTVSQLTPVTYYPSSAPVIGTGTNVGGDMVFDSKGKGYLITNNGNLYSFLKNGAGVDVTFLGNAPNSLSQVASLAFANDGRLFMGGVGTNVYSIDLQTLTSTVVNSTPSTNTSDMASCNFPVFEPVLNLSKTWKKTGGSAGSAILTGDTVEYRIFVQNVGNISAGNVKFTDQIPSGSSYVLGSTKLNGTAVNDFIFLFMPFSFTSGALINSIDQAFQSGAFSPVKYNATITFKVRVTATSGTISNTGKAIYGDSQQQVYSNAVSFEVCNPTTSIVGTTTFCAGSSTTLTAVDDGTWLWSTGATTQSITVSSPGTYSVTATSSPKGPGPNIIANSGFDSGNTGFSSDYTYTSGTAPAGNYGVATSATAFNSAYTNFYDHSTGGQMMLVNGSTSPNARIWYQTVVVQPNTTYDIGVFAMSLENSSAAQLYFTINGAAVGSVKTLSSKLGEYQKLTAEWASGSATSIVLAIVNQNLNDSGNDFAIDDIQMFPRTTAGCPKYASATVTMVTVSTANAGPDQAKCNNTAFTLAGNAPGSGETASWTVFSGSATVSSPSSNTSAATVPVGGCSVLQWKIQKGSCASVDVVTLCDDATVTANAGADLVNCSNSAFTLNATAPTGGATGLWSVVSGTATVATPGSNTSSATLTTTTSTLRWTVTSPNLACTAQDDVLLTNDLLAATASNTGPYCPGSNGQLNSSAANGYTPYSYSWTGPSNFTSSAQNPTLNYVTSVSAGTFTVTVTDSKGCSKSASTTVSLNSTPSKPTTISY